MGYSERATASDLSEMLTPETEACIGESHWSEGLPTNVKSYNFYQLVELLHLIEGLDPECINSTSSKLTFSSNPSLGFAASDVSSLVQTSQKRMKIETSFLGMSGAQSPLPSYFLEEILTENEETGLRKPFLDFFNHRLISLVFQIWRKYRYYIRFKEDATDTFSAQLFALVGLGDKELRGETPINWCKMLSYAGMLAGKSRSPQVVSGIIAHCFDLEDVSIRQWELRQVAIPEEQKMTLGKANVALGVDSVIGESVQDRCGKFVICIGSLSQERFKDFLPSGQEYQPLITLVEFVLREQMAFDLELSPQKNELPSMRLSRVSPASLGWTSFTGSSEAPRTVKIQVRR
ncbi:type VI secretion system baseplate subunit TssG [Enterovibrio paralichthyis]|uniref:type VI secretion system baseplate subunit TssG n=1 Tax=Enterovibrio paralichthyis TaxID=2853805 RepID=UPI001C4591E9|nr:type VI secretion system baseplate subunit TssG [Enterovibrio paralichthyis]MBV7298319.1 type VI secretion system baseplate subunit TssG [Enterovibrio paralichthyis]